MTRVLLTGASGFIGRHVVAALLGAGCKVHSVGRRPPDATQVHHHPADLLAWDGAREALASVRPDVIVHLAWTVEHGRFWTAPENLDWVAASLRLARAATEAGVGRFVGVGTCMEYDWSHDPGRPRREDDPLAASQLYGEAKIATFRLLERLFSGAGAPSFAWGRVFLPFGPGEPEAKLVPAIARAVRAGEPVTLRNGSSQRDFIAAPDVGIALAALALSSVAGPVNIASGEVVTVAELARLVQQIAGGGGTIVTGEAAGREPPTMAADVTRLRTEVGVPAPPPLSVRVAECLGAGA